VDKCFNYFLFCDAKDSLILYLDGAGFNSKTSHTLRSFLFFLSSIIQEQGEYFKFEHDYLLSPYLQGNIHSDIGRYIVRNKNGDVKKINNCDFN
jgi:hypothetical protein